MKKILVIVLLLSMYFVGQALGYATSYVRQANSGKVLSTENWAWDLEKKEQSPRAMSVRRSLNSMVRITWEAPKKR